MTMELTDFIISGRTKITSPIFRGRFWRRKKNPYHGLWTSDWPGHRWVNQPLKVQRAVPDPWKVLGRSPYNGTDGTLLQSQFHHDSRGFSCLLPWRNSIGLHNILNNYSLTFHLQTYTSFFNQILNQRHKPSHYCPYGAEYTPVWPNPVKYRPQVVTTRR